MISNSYLIINDYPAHINIDLLESKLNQSEKERIISVLKNFISNEESSKINSFSVKDFFEKYLSTVGATAKDKMHPFVTAIEKKNRRIIELYLSLSKKGFDVNSKGKDGRTAGHAAVELDNIDLLKELDKNGLDLEAADSFDNTILHDAVNRNSKACVRWLISRRVNLEARNSGSYTPAMLAQAERLNEIFRLLVDAGAVKPIDDN